MEHNKKWAIVSLASIPLVMTLGNSMLIPVLPTIEKKLKISSFQVSMVITLYSIVAIILIPIAGYLSDRIGRKKVIIPSLIIAGIGGLISGYAAWKMKDPYMMILIGRILQGVGAAGAAPVVMPLVGDMFKSEEEVSKELGVIETANTFGKVLSPILGSVLAGFIWYLPFFSIPVFTAISVILMFFLVQTPDKREDPLPFKEFLKCIKGIFKKDGKWLYSIFVIGCILMFVLFGVLFYLSDMLESKHNIDGIKKGFILAIPLAALCLSSYITGKKIKESKVLMKWITFGGTILLGASVFAISFSENIYFLIGTFVFCGIGIGVALPCLDALITEGIEKEERGTISSVYSSMRFIGVAAGPPVFVLLMKASHQVMFYSITGLCVIAAFIVLKEIKPDEIE
ncbi:MFS transporter [Bacillus sp. RD4P76]|uniref:MFS transporter n=2 Tax=Bacillus suaedaesalsae TaxID=2810349 RepID=A0ABS2DI10_9BACI|nr:MFS transporter [Bacillus suaedaesalsae]